MDFSNLKLSVLNLAPVRQGYDNAQAVQAMTELAQAVEQMGYDRYWIAEHHRPCKIFCVNVFLEVTGHTVTKYYTKLI